MSACSGTAAARHRVVHAARRAALRALVPDVLAAAGASTTRELAAEIPALPWLHHYFGGSECEVDGATGIGGCGGHGADLTNSVVWGSEVRAVLLELEAAGKAVRVVVPGVQAHLWSTPPSSCARARVRRISSTPPSEVT